MESEKRTSIALQRDTKIQLDMIKAKLQIPHDDVIKTLIASWIELKEKKEV